MRRDVCTQRMLKPGNVCCRLVKPMPFAATKRYKISNDMRFCYSLSARAAIPHAENHPATPY